MKSTLLPAIGIFAFVCLASARPSDAGEPEVLLRGMDAMEAYFSPDGK